MKLYIYLKNAVQNFDKISSALGQFDCSVEIENNQIVIVTSAFSKNVIDASNVGIVWEIGINIVEFLDIINGAAVIENFAMEKLELDHIKYEDNKGNKLHLPIVARVGGTLPFFLGSKPDISSFIPLALKDKAVAKVLRLCSKELDWANLYRIWEVISEDEGGLVNDQIKIFKGSANNSLVSGDSARHGKINVNMLNKTMSLANAQNMIKILVSDWIFRKNTT